MTTRERIILLVGILGGIIVGLYVYSVFQSFEWAFIASIGSTLLCTFIITLDAATPYA